MGCQPRCNNVPALLDDPTPNEQALWSYIASINQSECGKDSECIPLPILIEPTECEESFRTWLELNRNHCGSNTFCQYVPPLLDELCPSNLKVLEFAVPPVPDDDAGGGQGGQGTGGNECDPLTGGPLIISQALDPNTLGGNFGEVSCSASLPEMRFRASGGVPPYSWALSGKAGCTFGGVGGPGFGGPTTDSLCDSRFVVTSPVDAGGFVGQVAFYIVGSPVDGADCFGQRGICRIVIFECDDVAQLGTLGDNFFCTCRTTGCPPSTGGLNNCANIPPVCQNANLPGCGFVICGSTTDISPEIKSFRQSVVVDCRTAAMLSGNCAPCSLCWSNLVVTVTDSVGTMVSITINIKKDSA